MVTRALEAATVAANKNANKGPGQNNGKKQPNRNLARDSNRSESRAYNGPTKSPKLNDQHYSQAKGSDQYCYRCSEQGHGTKSCNAVMKGSESGREVLLSHNAVENERFELKGLDMRGGASAVFASFVDDKSTQQYPVLLDNQSEVSIINASFLQDITPLKKPITIYGIGGAACILKHKGRLPMFDIDCYASYDNIANILCYADVAALYPITALSRAFIAHLPDRDVVFSLEGKLYIASLKPWIKNSVCKKVYFSSVSELEKLYNEKERKMAKKAWQFAKRAIAPSLEEAIRLATFGNITGIGFTAADLRRAYDIYGRLIEAIKGRMTKKKVARQEIETTSKWTDRPQNMTMDLVFIDHQIFLLTVTNPLQLT